MYESKRQRRAQLGSLENVSHHPNILENIHSSSRQEILAVSYRANFGFEIFDHDLLPSLLIPRIWRGTPSISQMISIHEINKRNEKWRETKRRLVDKTGRGQIKQRKACKSKARAQSRKTNKQQNETKTQTKTTHRVHKQNKTRTSCTEQRED